MYDLLFSSKRKEVKWWRHVQWMMRFQILLLKSVSHDSGSLFFNTNQYIRLYVHNFTSYFWINVLKQHKICFKKMSIQLRKIEKFQCTGYLIDYTFYIISDNRWWKFSDFPIPITINNFKLNLTPITYRHYVDILMQFV